ncbi:intein C-terminal splicing region [Anaerosporobacter mobilis DSM 15930]|uniref:Intein C-terminal splicing region n=1 Tax=Anaerosporobacter mobilis DSM 15930 TaxID=1120996 RepID=A0A1M7NND8_9FIRM|nr:polymorphic toxin-type HINT domain-containing protein [Anaerosporobacter mobilis]SHN05405.1 intein C-terminal splicing region [Anaerosporobacter mobilis DSM 15930]
MATIALYSNQIAQMSGKLGEVKKTVGDYKSELFSLKTKALAIKQSICNMEDVISSIQASTSVQEEKVDSLEQVRGSSEQFIEDTYRIDGNVADLVNKRKDDFYDQYKYLKPESEKNPLEKIKDGLKKVGEWCKEHWKIIVTVVLVIAAIAAIVVITAIAAILAASGLVLGPLLIIALGVAKGLVAGAIIGGIIGGLSSVAAGGSFFEGFEEGAFSGAFIGALFGGIGGIGQVLGQSCKVLGNIGKIAKIIPTVSKISGAISLGMAGFDLLSLGVSLFDPKSPLVQFNKKLHESSLYNGFQMTISTLAVFTAGFTKGMKNPICFVAGTMVLTAMGLKAIETIQAGDQVIATNPDTFQTEEKTVVETYINKTTCIVKIFIQNEVIYTTMNHPFYVKGQGFVAAGKLSIGDEIMNASGGSYPVECVELEEKQETVYNFQVEDFHTYYVGENSVLVHNDCPEGGSETSSPYELEATHSQTSSKKNMNKLIEDIKNNGINETIKYVEHNGQKYVVDGHHRLIAAKRLGIKEIPIEKVELPYAGYKSIEDLLWFD